jgi:hypothetical protein
MGTPPHVSAPRAAAWLAGLVALLSACGPGGGNNVASHSPSAATSPASAASPSGHPAASPTASATAAPIPARTPQPVTGAYGVLYGSQAATTYTVSIVGIDGKVVASADASTPPSPTCASAAAALVSPPVSMSNSSVYFMDASGAVHWLEPNGQKDQAPIATLPSPTTSRRSMFAVSPDDAEMAVVVDDFTSSGANTNLYIYDLNAGGTQRLVYSQTGAYTLWPVGWHGTNNLVLAKVTSCTQGGGPFCCGPLELHVVDPATGNRRFTLGGPGCVPAGPASPGGVVCEDTAGFTTAREVNWTNGVFNSFPIQGPAPSFLAPDGVHAALVVNGQTRMSPVTIRYMDMQSCGWIDGSHLIAGGDLQTQARVGDVLAGTTAPVAAQGDCAGRLPGGL